MLGGAGECPYPLQMRICVVYDCLFPWTVGGGERWYRALSESLASAGHDVTYLTLRQWDADQPPAIPGVKVIAVGPRMDLYRAGKRRIVPPLLFGLGVGLHMLRQGRRYDHVHAASFPFFSVLALALLRPLFGYSLGIDWHEVWSRSYWREYLGPLGRIGWWVQAWCAKVPHDAFVFSRLHGRRLVELGRVPVLLSGEYAGGAKARAPAAAPLVVLYAGRMIAEKRIGLLVDAFALVIRRRPDCRLTLSGDGPERAALRAQVEAAGLGPAVDMPGFVAEDLLDRMMREAALLVQPSSREGYGMVVVEAAVRAVPVVVVEGEDNAAVELVESGENGLIAAADPEALARAIEAVLDDNAAWRRRSGDWYDHNAQRLSLASSLATVGDAIDPARSLKR